MTLGWNWWESHRNMSSSAIWRFPPNHPLLFGIFHEINHPFVGIPRTQDFDLFLFWVKSPSMIGGSPTCGMVNRLVSVFIITHLSVPFDY